MSDKKEDNKVTSLVDVRREREHEKGHEQHAAGLAWRFMPYEYEEEPPMGVCVMEGDMPIGILMDKENASGICMTKESARKLGTALLEAAESDIIHEEYEPEPPKAG